MVVMTMPNTVQLLTRVIPVTGPFESIMFV